MQKEVNQKKNMRKERKPRSPRKPDKQKAATEDKMPSFIVKKSDIWYLDEERNKWLHSDFVLSYAKRRYPEFYDKVIPEKQYKDHWHHDRIIQAASKSKSRYYRNLKAAKRRWGID